MKALNFISKIMNDYGHIDKFQGSIIGFMVGDALGLPVAGIPDTIVRKNFKYIQTYQSHRINPYTYSLQPGNYGSNSKLLLITLSSITENNAYSSTQIFKELTRFARQAQKNPAVGRWIGPTITEALLLKKPTTKPSGTHIYPALPLALFVKDLGTMLRVILSQSRYTHSNLESIAAAEFLAITIHEIIYNKLTIRNASLKAYEYITHKYTSLGLFGKNLSLVLTRKIPTINNARRILGTGSYVHMYIPLALYCVLRYPHSFPKAVCMAINSYRHDSPEEKEKLKEFSYIEQLQICKRGDTNALGSIAGLLSGASLGITNIPHALLTKLEDKNKVVDMIDRINLLHFRASVGVL